ncbi:MAG: tetraacyldisaccharide 4'-kinase [Bacteroidota bacterium]|nr:tetraacyldisaccharide 4'-kinase [Bacteroidota bacterium]
MYWLITLIRNFLFDYGILKSKAFEDVFVLCVGNIRVGGTGKTPMVEYLINALKDDFNIAVLSLGYKRKTKGIREISKQDDFQSVGDEPMQMFERFPMIKFFVNKDRNKAISFIKEKYPNTQVIILDDAYQYRKTKPNRTILLTEYYRPFYKDFLLPYGRLRERRKEKKRADYIVVSKTPNNLTKEEKQQVVSKIKPNERQQVFFASIGYNEDIKQVLEGKEVALLVGIDNPKPLQNYLQTFCKINKVLKFPDHHSFSQKELEKISNITLPIVTTRKDFTRIKNTKAKIFIQDIQIVIDHTFIENIKKDIKQSGIQ